MLILNVGTLHKLAQVVFVPIHFTQGFSGDLPKDRARSTSDYSWEKTQRQVAFTQPERAFEGGWESIRRIRISSSISCSGFGRMQQWPVLARINFKPNRWGINWELGSWNWGCPNWRYYFSPPPIPASMGWFRGNPQLGSRPYPQWPCRWRGRISGPQSGTLPCHSEVDTRNGRRRGPSQNSQDCRELQRIGRVQRCTDSWGRRTSGHLSRPTQCSLAWRNIDSGKPGLRGEFGPVQWPRMGIGINQLTQV